MRFHTLILGHKQGHRFCGGRVLWFGTISEDRTNREVVLFANQGPGTRANDGHRSVVCRLKIDTERAIARGEGDGLMEIGRASCRERGVDRGGGRIVKEKSVQREMT